MVQLVHEVAHLIFERSDFSVALSELLLLRFQVECFLVDQSVEFLNLVQRLADFKFEVANVAAQVITLIGLDFISDVESIDFFEVFPVTLSESRQFIISLSFLGLEAGVGILADLLLVLDALDVDVAVGDERSLPVQFRVQLSVLPLPVVINRALLIDLRSQSLYEANIGVDARLVVFIHSSLLLIQSAEILLHIHQLVLQLLVVALALSQIRGLLHQLSDHALFLGRRTSAVTTRAVAARFNLVHLRHIESRLR